VIGLAGTIPIQWLSELGFSGSGGLLAPRGAIGGFQALLVGRSAALATLAFVLLGLEAVGAWPVGGGPH